MTLKAMHAVYVEWGLMSLAVPIIGARFYFQKTRKGRLFWGDWFILIAWIAFAFQTASDWTMRHFFHPKEIFVSVGDNTTLGSMRAGRTWQHTIIIAKLKYSQNVTYYTCLYFVKFAWLCFFHQLLPRTLPWLRKTYWWVTGISIVGYLFTTLINIFYCWPINTRWSLHDDYCANAEWVWICIMTIHSVTDLILYMLPILLLRAVTSLSQKSRLSVVCIFALGFICVGWAILLQVQNLTFVSGAVICLTGAFEQFWALFVVCLPPLKSLATAEGGVIRKSWMSLRKNSHSKAMTTETDDPENTYHESKLVDVNTTTVSVDRSIDREMKDEEGQSSKTLTRGVPTEVKIN